MEQIPQSELIPTIEKVQEQFEAWRQSRVKRSAIPDVLWQTAVNLCQEHPISKVSSTLRLNYAELKHRVHVFAVNHPAPCISTLLVLLVVPAIFCVFNDFGWVAVEKGQDSSLS